MPPSESVSVVVPVYRNADTLDELHRRLDAALSGEDVELVFVHDACPAGSAVALERLRASDPRVRVIRHGENAGQHRAILTGLAQARGERIAIMDADLQDRPEALPALLDRARRGDVDAVFAGRRGRYESGPRLVGSRLFKRVLHATTGVPTDAGAFVVVSARLARELLAMGTPDATVVAMIGCARLPVTSIPVEREPRASGRSAYGGLDRARTAWRTFVWIASWKLRAARGSG